MICSSGNSSLAKAEKTRKNQINNSILLLYFRGFSCALLVLGLYFRDNSIYFNDLISHPQFKHMFHILIIKKLVLRESNFYVQAFSFRTSLIKGLYHLDVNHMTKINSSTRFVHTLSINTVRT